MSVRQADVDVRYVLSTVDRGVRQAVTLSQNLSRETRSAQKQLDASLRANSTAWKDTARVATSAQRQVGEAATKASSHVDKSLLREIESLRRAGVGYKEISAAARHWGTSAEQAAAAVKRSADIEIRQIERVANARKRLRSMVGLGPGGGHTAGPQERGFERGAVRAAAGRFRGGISFLGAGLVGGLAGYASIEGAKHAVDFTKELAIHTRTLSSITGMDTKTAEQWIAITEARGIKTKAFAATLKALSTQTEGALTGGKKQVAMFHALGITTDDLKKHSGNLSDTLGLVADHLNKMPGGAEKTAIASKLLGRGYTTLMPVLLQGSKGMADQRKEAAALGITLGGNAAENAKKLEEASINLKIAQMGLQVQFAEHVAPALIKVVTGGIKLFGVLRHDLGPAFHFVAGEVKDVTHWLGQHKTVLKAVEYGLIGLAAGYAGLKVISGTVRLVRGLANDFMTAKNAVGSLARPISALKGLFAEQETESVALMRSQTALADANVRLAASFDQVAVASKGAAGGEVLAGEAGALAGGAPILARGKGAGAVPGAQAAGMSEAQLAQDGVLGAMLGKQGVSTIRTNLKTLLGTAGKGLLYGFLGNQLGNLGGGIVGGKKGASIGQFAGTGAGIGFAVGGPWGAALGAGVGGLAALTAGDTQTASGAAKDATAKFAKQIQDAARRNDVDQLKTLSFQAKALGANWVTARGAFTKLAQASSWAAQQIQNTRAGRAVTGIESSIVGSKYAPTVRQITSATVSGLANVGPQAQRAGAAAIVKFTAGLESQKRLPVGSTDRLIKQLEGKYGPAFASALQSAGTSSMKMFENTVARSKVVNKVQQQVDQMHKQWGLLVPDVKVTSDNIRQVMTDNIEAMRQKVLHTTGKERQDAIDHLNALLKLYAQYSPLIAAAGASAFTAMSKTVTGTLSALGRTIGGSLGGWATLISQFAQAVTPALSTIAGAVQSGALSTPSGAKSAGDALANIFKPFRKAEGGYFHGAVPGDHTRDGTLAWLSGREFVMTGHGQSMMDAYAPGLLDHIAASQAPHFATGGRIPRFAAGGNVWNVRASSEDAASGTGWTELSTNGNAAAVSGHPHTATHSGGWDFATLGRMYPKGTKLRISSGRRSGVFPLTDFGDGSSFAPAIGLTPAVQSALGGMPSTVNISLADGGNIALASGFGKLVSGSSASAAKGGSAAKGRSASARSITKTTFAPSGPGLKDQFMEGYVYGLDPFGGSGMSPAAALRAGILGSQLTAHTTTTPGVGKFSLAGLNLGKLPKSLQGKGKLSALDASMTAVARHFLGHPYIAAGGAANGRPPNLGANGLDCSAYVSAIVNLGGRGLLPQVPSPWTTDPLKSWGLPGNGRYITVGVRGTSGGNAHTMIDAFGKFWESSHPGKGPHQDPGWSEDFPIRRHPPGLRRGGHVPSGPRYNDAGWWFKQRGMKPPGGYRRGGHIAGVPRFQGGGGVNWGYVPPGGGRYRPPTRRGIHPIGSYGPFANTTAGLPSTLTYQPATTLDQVLALAPIIPSNYGAGRGIPHGTRTALTHATAAISRGGSNADAAKALSSFAKAIDSVRKISYRGLLDEAKHLEREIRAAGKAGHGREVTRLKQALQLVNNQAGVRVGRLVKAATDEAGALQGANQRLTNLLTRSKIDPASGFGTAMISKFQDQSVKVIRDEVKKLQKAYDLAKKAGNKRVVGDISIKLRDAISALDDATAQAVQAQVDAANAAKQAVLDAAQAKVDTATHDVTMASTGEQNLQLQEQLAGTSGTMAGAKQLSDYINQTVVPAMQKQVATLQEQQATAQAQGNTALAQQIAEQIQSTQGGIMQEQLTAQQAIQQATQATAQNTQQLVGNLGVSYGGGTFGNLASMLNGA